MDVYVQRERCNRINDNLAKPRGGDYWTGWKKIRKEKRVGARHRATDKRLSIREEIGSSRLRPLSKYTVTQYWHASLVKMLCVYKHIIYIYNFTKIKQRRYWIVSIHIPGDRKVIYHLFESRKNLVYVISVGLISEKIVKREEKRRKTTADRRAAACAFCENRVTRFREKRKKKTAGPGWSRLENPVGERGGWPVQGTGPLPRSTSEGGKKRRRTCLGRLNGGNRALPSQSRRPVTQIRRSSTKGTARQGKGEAKEKEKGDAFETFPGKRCGKRGERGERKSFWGINQVGIVN